MEQQQKNSGGDSLIIIFLVLLLVGGGVGAWFLLKPKSTDETTEEPADTREQLGEIGGNKNYDLEDEEQIAGGISDPTKSSTFTPVKDEKELYLYGSEAQQLLTELAKRLAQSNEVMGKLRKQHNIGQPFVGSNYTAKAKSAIDWMFSQNFTNVIAGNPATYPIFSTWETQNKGKQVHDEIQRLVNTDWSRMGLSNRRIGGEPWYITALDLNLFYGKRGIHTHSADQIKWYKADRGGLDMYKQFNGHDVNDLRLIEFNSAQGRESFPAGTTHTIARDWLAEIQRLDKAVLIEAQSRLEAQGWKFTLVDNQTNA
jgi:hypothetical protein